MSAVESVIAKSTSLRCHDVIRCGLSHEAAVYTSDKVEFKISGVIDRHRGQATGRSIPVIPTYHLVADHIRSWAPFPIFETDNDVSREFGRETSVEWIGAVWFCEIKMEQQAIEWTTSLVTHQRDFQASPRFLNITLCSES